MAFITLDKTYIVAGDTFRITITDYDGSQYDLIPYTISGTGLLASHLTPSSLSGNVELGNNKSGFIDIQTSSDLPTGEDYLELTVSSTGYADRTIKVYSYDNYIIEDSVSHADSFNSWRKKTNGMLVKLQSIEEGKTLVRTQTTIGDGSNASFTLSFTPTTDNTAFYDVNIDGIAQDPNSAYTIDVNAGTINFGEVPAYGSNISIVHKYDSADVLYDTQGTPTQTAAQIRDAYESNADRNAFTDALLDKVNDSLDQPAVQTLLDAQTHTVSEITDLDSSFANKTVIDDDTMATASSTNLATAESIKAYVDSYVDEYSLKYSGATGTISVTGSYVYSDLDLSATVGSNRALVILELQGSSQGVNMFFRTKGSSMKPRDADSYAGWGASGGVVGGSNDGFIATVITNAEGVVEYTARSAVTGISYTVQAYQKLA